MELLRGKVKQFSKELWKPYEINKTKVNSNSWFDMNIGKNNKKHSTFKHSFEKDNIPECSYKCKKIIILPNEYQKEILFKWFEIYRKMYNETLKVIKTSFYRKEDINLDYKNVRTNYMKPIKEKLYNISGIEQNINKTRINKHILDGAIKDACTSYKSALTNLKVKNIKHFRVRFIKQSKPYKILKIEKGLFSRNKKSFCSSVLGKKIKTTGEDRFKCVKTDCTLSYNSVNKHFVLFVPIKIVNDTKKVKTKSIGLDPGIRTFMTGYSEKHTLEIGNNLTDTIKRYLMQIDALNGSYLKQLNVSKMKRAIIKRYNKISNLVDDLHWKTINHLTNEYQTILIGNLSTKGIVCNHISDMTKRIALIMRLYVFKERLKFKCSIKGRNYKLIDEHYTSKMCTFCGNINNELGSSKVYECDKCKTQIGRDVNGARNIYMLGIK